MDYRLSFLLLFFFGLHPGFSRAYATSPSVSLNELLTNEEKNSGLNPSKGPKKADVTNNINRVNNKKSRTPPVLK